VRACVLAAGRRPRRVAGWLEDIEIVLTPNLYSFQLQVVFVMLLCEPWQPCVRARSREQQGGEGVRGFAAVGTGIGEEANDCLLCRRAALQAHGECHGRPDQKLPGTHLLRMRMLATAVWGTHPRASARGGGGQ